MCECDGAGRTCARGEGQLACLPWCRGPALPSPQPLEFLRAGLYPPGDVVLHSWVGLSWVPIVGPADPILRVETAFQRFLLALH